MDLLPQSYGHWGSKMAHLLAGKAVVDITVMTKDFGDLIRAVIDVLQNKDGCKVGQYINIVANILLLKILLC